MALLRVDARALVPRLRAELAALLTGLTGGDWGRPTACPGWSVHDVAAHLLGAELGNVSVRRDRWGLGPAKGEDLDACSTALTSSGWTRRGGSARPCSSSWSTWRAAADLAGRSQIAGALAGVKAVLG